MFSVFLKIWFRREIISILFLVVALPVSLSSILSSSIEALSGSSLYYSGSVEGIIIIHGVDNKSSIHLDVFYAYARVYSNGKTLDNIPVYVMDPHSLETMAEQRLIEGGVSAGNTTLLLGERLALILGIKPGGKIALSLNGSTREYRVSGLFSGIPQLEYSIILVIEGYKGSMELSKTRTSRSPILFEELTRDIRGILQVLTICVVAVYTPLLYIGYSKIIDRLKREYRILYSLGIRRWRLAVYSAITALIYSATLSIYGVSLGRVVVDASSMLIRVLTGLPVPQLDPYSFLHYTLISTIYYPSLSALSTGLLVYRERLDEKI